MDLRSTSPQAVAALSSSLLTLNCLHWWWMHRSSHTYTVIYSHTDETQHRWNSYWDDWEATTGGFWSIERSDCFEWDSPNFETQHHQWIDYLLICPENSLTNIACLAKVASQNYVVHSVFHRKHWLVKDSHTTPTNLHLIFLLNSKWGWDRQFPIRHMWCLVFCRIAPVRLVMGKPSFLDSWSEWRK